MVLAELKGHWALVTGASAGIGREFAGQLAGTGVNLVLVARRRAILEAFAADLSARHAVRALPIAMDLSEPGVASAIRARLVREHIRIRLLCNNAGFGRWGRFEDTPLDSYERMVRVNTSVIVALCHVFLPDLASHHSSAIINVSSPAALQPMPYMAVYAASKAFVHQFSQALHGEWKERGVLVQTLVPGPTATEFDRLAGAYESALKDRGTPDRVVRDCLAHLARNSAVANSARGTYKQRLFAGLFPPSLVISAVGRMFRPPAGKP